MSIVENQQRVLQTLLTRLRPHWRSDRALPARIQRLLADRRFGSKDRRLYRELLFTAIRILPRIESLDGDHCVARIAGHCERNADTARFCEAFASSAPNEDEDKLPSLLPDWLHDECPAAFSPAEYAALQRRAPLWLRLQSSDERTVREEFAARAWPHTPSAILPSAWKLKPGTPVEQTEAYRNGLVEIQDLGSQLLLSAYAIPQGGHWLDACAGAGGKTLQLAQIIGPQGRIDAHDIRADALCELKRRATRAAIPTITTTGQVSGLYDGILIDAPCSGSGTWRRNPHLKWTTSAADVQKSAARQNALLDQYARHARHGTWLIYATCSLCRTENTAVAGKFRQTHPDFKTLPLAQTFGFETDDEGGLSLLPARHDTDGFYVIAWQRQ